jgi:hypothetical protein
MIRSPMPPRKTGLKATTIKASGKRMRSLRPKMTPARKAAKGQCCMVRLPGCDGGGETTVLAHYRLAGYCGTGIKPPDDMGAWACVQCHDRIDGRINCGLPHAELRLAHAEGVMRTQQAIREPCK